MENISYVQEYPENGVRTVVTSTDEYCSLIRTVLDATKRAANTKGKERHATEGEYFESQPICEITRMLGDIGHGGPRFQAIKKLLEAGRLSKRQALAELQDVICYIAGDILVLEEEIDMEELDEAKK